MSLYFLNFDVNSMKTVRSQLAQCIPNAKRSHLAECVAAGLGFKSSIALQTSLRGQSLEDNRIKRFEIDAFFSRLKTFGYSLDKNQCASTFSLALKVLTQCHLCNTPDGSSPNTNVCIDATLSIGRAEVFAQLLVELVRQRNGDSQMCIQRLFALVEGVFCVLVEMRDMGILRITPETIVHHLPLRTLRILASDNRVCNTARVGLHRYLSALPGYTPGISISVEAQSMHDYLASMVQREMACLRTED